jgi:hypothetical protein
MKPAAESLPIAMRAAGIMPKGEPLARVIWLACEQIFAAAPPDAPPFEVAELVGLLARYWAADVDLDRRQRQAAAAKQKRRKRSSDKKA